MDMTSDCSNIVIYYLLSINILI